MVDFLYFYPLLINDKHLLFLKLQNFYNLCSKGINIYKKRFKKNANPKFSLIIPVLNKVTYLNRLITEYERLRYIYANNNKNIIILFAMKQQNIFLEYIQFMREIMGKMDQCYVPEVNDTEKFFEMNNEINNYDDNQSEVSYNK